MSEENKHYYKQQNTLRLSKLDLEFVDENYIEIAGTDEKIPVAKFFIKAVTIAASNLKAKEVIKEVSKSEDLTLIEQLKASNEEKDTKILMLEQQLSALTEQNEELLNTPKLASHIIPLDFSKDWRKYFWGVLQVAKKQKFAGSYEELLQKIFRVVNKRGELVLTEKDYQYLDTLDYDCPEYDVIEKEPKKEASNE